MSNYRKLCMAMYLVGETHHKRLDILDKEGDSITRASNEFLCEFANKFNKTICIPVENNFIDAIECLQSKAANIEDDHGDMAFKQLLLILHVCSEYVSITRVAPMSENEFWKWLAERLMAIVPIFALFNIREEKEKNEENTQP